MKKRIVIALAILIVILGGCSNPVASSNESENSLTDTPGRGATGEDATPRDGGDLELPVDDAPEADPSEDGALGDGDTPDREPTGEDGTPRDGGDGGIVFAYEPGDTGPTGGVIVYVDTENEHDWAYMEAAPNSIALPFAESLARFDRPFNPATDTDETYPFGTYAAEFFALGQGESNTAQILSRLQQRGDEQPEDGANRLSNVFFAALMLEDDWFLPSVEEARQMVEYTAALDAAFNAPWSSGTTPPYTLLMTSNEVRDDIVAARDNTAFRRSVAVRISGDQKGETVNVPRNLQTLLVRPVRTF